MRIYNIDDIDEDPDEPNALHSATKDTKEFEKKTNNFLEAQRYHLALNTKSVQGEGFNSVFKIWQNIIDMSSGNSAIAPQGIPLPIPFNTGLKTYNATLTFYYPFQNKLEGGYNDCVGHPLGTVEGYLSGRDPYVSIAGDKNLLSKSKVITGRILYGSIIRIEYLERTFGRAVLCRFVDVGGGFTGTGTSRLDVCVDTESTANRLGRIKSRWSLTGGNPTIPQYPPVKNSNYNRLDWNNYLPH